MWIPIYPSIPPSISLNNLSCCLSPCSGGRDDGKILTESVVWLEEMNPSDPNHYYQIDLDNMVPPRVFKSHTPYNMLPGGAPHTTPARYVYVARNPKDVLVSYYYHCLTWKSMQFTGTWDQFYAMYMNSKIPFGSWFDHVLEWWEHKDAENILFLKYEDMKKDLRGTVEAIAKFIGYDLSQDVISSIVTDSTFDNMQKNPTANYSWWDDRRTPEFVPFLRKGMVGDWRNHFTPQQSEEFDALYSKRMKGSGLDFDFGQN